MNKKDRKFISGENLTDEEIIQRFKIKTVEVRLKDKAQGSSFLMWIVILFFLAGILLYFISPNFAPNYTPFTLIFFSTGLFLFITFRLNKNLRKFEVDGTAEKLKDELNSEILDIRNKLNIASNTANEVEKDDIRTQDKG